MTGAMSRTVSRREAEQLWIDCMLGMRRVELEILAGAMTADVLQDHLNHFGSQAFGDSLNDREIFLIED